MSTQFLETVEVEARREHEILRYGVLAEPPRTDLTALVQVAAQVAGLPMASINLMMGAEQHSIAAAGFDPSVCRRADSMCNLALRESGPVIVPDARLDVRFRDNPFVTGDLGSVRFYASHQLITPDAVVIGTLCVFDEVSRTISPEQERSLAALAERVVDLLELEVRTRDLSNSLAELRQVQSELERSNEQLAAFAGQVSHDLVNPLAVMTMSVRMLEEQLGEQDENDEARWLVTRARAGAERMQGLIDGLLSYARIGGQLERAEVHLGDLVGEVCEDLSGVLGNARLEVGELPVVTGDAIQLRAVLQNLLANAAKFGHPGQTATIRMSSRRAARGWRVEIADEGVGIPESDRERVFAPLARIEETDAEGSGIGLATVRRVIDAHGGSIGITETPGGGTTVWFELPD